MTTVFYDGKNLHADKRVLHSCYPSRITNDGIKIIINKENTIAIGISGLLPDEKKKTELFLLANLIFLMSYSGKFDDSLQLGSLPTKLKMQGEMPHLIGITSNRAFLIKEGMVYPQTGFITAIGSGHRSIVGCYYVVQDIKKAFQLSSEIDTLSSPEYMSVMAESLNPYTVE